jgi:hypothetical protein
LNITSSILVEIPGGSTTAGRLRLHVKQFAGPQGTTSVIIPL